MDITECIAGRRSVRAYTGEQIPRETMQELLRLATMAATGSNQQPWGFVVIQDRAEISRLSSEIKEHLLGHLESFPYLKQYQAWLEKPENCVLNHASDLLIIYGDTGSHYYAYDCTLAAANVMLAARGMGIGTCWIGFAEYLFNTQAFKSRYSVPDGYELVCPMTLGFEKDPLPPPTRKPPLVFHW